MNEWVESEHNTLNRFLTRFYSSTKKLCRPNWESFLNLGVYDSTNCEILNIIGVWNGFTDFRRNYINISRITKLDYTDEIGSQQYVEAINRSTNLLTPIQLGPRPHPDPFNTIALHAHRHPDLIEQYIDIYIILLSVFWQAGQIGYTIGCIGQLLWPNKISWRVYNVHRQ